MTASNSTIRVSELFKAKLSTRFVERMSFEPLIIGSQIGRIGGTTVHITLNGINRRNQPLLSLRVRSANGLTERIFRMQPTSPRVYTEVDRALRFIAKHYRGASVVLEDGTTGERFA